VSLSILVVGVLLTLLFCPKPYKPYLVCVVLLLAMAVEFRAELIARQEGIKVKSLYLNTSPKTRLAF
jgi:hypothetical protein